MWRRRLIGEWRERKQITGRRREEREETEEDDREMKCFSINYKTMAATEIHRNSMEISSHNMRKE